MLQYDTIVPFLHISRLHEYPLFLLSKLIEKKTDIFLEIRNKTRTFAPAFNKQPITRCP